jgi:hypothetical protein
MPTVIWGIPPKNCPICGTRVWSLKITQRPYIARSLYDTHLYENHREYMRWNEKMSYYYAVSLLLFVGSAPIAWLVQTFPAPTFLAQLTVLLFWAAAFAVGIAIRLLKRRGKRRFRELWNEGHSRPMNDLKLPQ